MLAYAVRVIELEDGWCVKLCPLQESIDAIPHEHGLTEGAKRKFSSGLTVASNLATLWGAAGPYVAPVFNHIDLGAMLMGMTAAFGLGGAVLGTNDVQIAESFTSSEFRHAVPQGVKVLPFPPYF